MFRKRKIQKENYDRAILKPVIKASICNGEQVAGFQNQQTGKFEEVMLVKGEQDLQDFMERYDIKREEIGKIY